MIPALSSHHLNLSDEAATRAFAERLATQLRLDRSVLRSGLVIFLSGSLGAGKTTWVRGLLNALGHQGRVRSPSFTIMEPYTLDTLQIYHFDFYRFTASEEWREAGFDELIGAPGSLSLIEWPEMAEQSLAPPDWWMRLGILEKDTSARDEPNADAAESDTATDAQTQAETEIDSNTSRTLDIQCFSAVGANLATRVLNQ